ncbi:uncharacterized protein ACWYII_035852 [Salvelinus alpinus]|uniref:interleukin-17F n=1 Tax=Salvelinus alpinus TaxID=8036 RepID=UPI0039FC745F
MDISSERTKGYQEQQQPRQKATETHSRDRNRLQNRKPELTPELNMQQLQHLRLLLLCLLAMRQCLCVPLGGQCVDESFCTSSLQEYHAQLVSLPNRLNERSVAAWNYVEKIDLNRVPPVLYEANCLESHSCKGMDSTLSLESIPITLRMPVLRKNPRCSSFSLEFEPINIACICATSRQSGFLTDRF